MLHGSIIGAIVRRALSTYVWRDWGELHVQKLVRERVMESVAGLPEAWLAYFKAGLFEQVAKRD